MPTRETDPDPLSQRQAPAWQPAPAGDIQPSEKLIHAQKLIHVDRARQIRLFRKMIEGNLQQHIFLVCAESGMGKSSLLRQFCKICDKLPNLLRAQLNLDLNYDPIEILHTISLRLCTYKLDDFVRLYKEYTESYTGRRWNHDSYRGWCHRLTNAFFEDISASTGSKDRIIIIVDNYHRSTPNVKEWFCRSFLNYVHDRCRLIVVVSGQSVPDLDIAFHGRYQLEFLHPLKSKDILLYASRLKLDIPRGELTSIYKSTGGRPLELALEISKRLTQE